MYCSFECQILAQYAVKCSGILQVTQSGSTRSRARRWARVVDSATWPEILKRYLLSSRKSAGLYAINGEKNSSNPCFSTLSNPPLAYILKIITRFSGFETLHMQDITPIQLFYLFILARFIKWQVLICFLAHSVAIEDMDDQCVGLRAARDLMVMPYYKLKPEMHLRLLHALCNDIVNCQGMKNAMTVRIEEVSRLNVEKFHADAEVLLLFDRSISCSEFLYTCILHLQALQYEISRHPVI